MDAAQEVGRECGLVMSLCPNLVAYPFVHVYQLLDIMGGQVSLDISGEYIAETAHASSCLFTASDLVNGVDFWWPRSETVSKEEVRFLSPRTVYHLLVRRSSLYPVWGCG